MSDFFAPRSRDPGPQIASPDVFELLRQRLAKRPQPQYRVDVGTPQIQGGTGVEIGEPELEIPPLEFILNRSR